jgi:hypothetical protein
MTRSSTLFLSLAGLLCAASTAGAQPQRPSPPDTTSVTISGKTITISYSRPSMKGRKIFGGLVPYGQVWRTGANEATTFTTSGDLTLGGTLSVPAGTYALFTIPGESEWTVILNKVPKQWGAFSYEKNKAQDLGQIKVKSASLSAPVEQFKMTLSSAGGNGGSLKLEWENTSVSVPFTVK